MSQTKQWSVAKGNTVRRNFSSGATAGAGNSPSLYVGRQGSYDYDSYLQFTQDWTGVGKIVSAVLNIYTDDNGGPAGDVMSSTDTPRIYVKRLTDSFTEGVSPGSTFNTNDYTSSGATTAGQVRPLMNKAVLGLNSIDITAIVEAMAPKTVKTRAGAAGGNATNYGIGLFGETELIRMWAGLSEDYSNSTYRPTITLTYEYGATVPDTPGSLAPSGSIAGLSDFVGTFSDVRPTDTLAYSEVEVYTDAAFTVATSDLFTSTAHGLTAGQVIYLTSLTGGAGLATLTAYYVIASGLTADAFKVSTTSGGAAVNVTTTGSGTWGRKVYGPVKKAASAAEIANAVFDHVPDAFTVVSGSTYKWRGRVYDQEGQVSAYTALTSFSTTNTVPSAPTLTPANATSFATLDGVKFESGAFSDPDAGDTLLAYQVQMSAYASGDSHWTDATYILWDTGKTYVVPGDTTFSVPYGGAALTAGTYYWRARVWDSEQGVSAWTYKSIVVTADYAPNPDGTQTAIQLRPKAPWRLVIKAMGTLRGPGATVAIIDDAKNVGASILYNSPGECHFTLPKNHPAVASIEVKRVHYAIEFRQGDGWREVFAGLMWDFDASDTDIVFYGIDYLALLDYIVDERYDASNPDKPAEKGGSKYVTTGKNSISYIVTDQLGRAKALTNSPVGFITVGSIASMTETLTVFSTYAPTLTFITGLLDSHRAGLNKRTRLSCRQKTGGGYEWVVQDDPGTVRDNLRMRYGELVQGYRVIPFGSNWASRISAIGRAKDGIAVLYKTATAPGIDESVWGHFAQVRLIDGVSDENDLQRRVNQAAVHSGKLGSSIALGLRTGLLQPRDGYDVCDQFPIDIVDGSVDTGNFGSGYWVAVGITWTTAAQTAKQTTTLTFTPRDDATSPDSDLLVAQPISPQAEWQVGWTSPNPLTASSRYWLDQTTGIVYIRTAGTLVVDGTLTGTA